MCAVGETREETNRGIIESIVTTIRIYLAISYQGEAADYSWMIHCEVERVRECSSSFDDDCVQKQSSVCARFLGRSSRCNSRESEPYAD